MTGWPMKPLGEICREGGGFIRTGPFGSQLHQSDYTDDPAGIPVIMPKDMAGGRIDLSSIARIDAATAERLSQHLLAADDVVLSRRGDVGRSAWIFSTDLPAFCGTGSMRVHPGQPTSLRPEFLRFFFRSRLAADYLEAHAVGVTMPNLNAKIVESLPVPLLPHAIQDLAVSVLSAIDDLIDNNRRRVAVLEEMTREIHREWFIRLRFPGHRETAFVESPFGPIPNEWRAVTLGEVVELKYGKALKADARNGGDVAVVGSSGIVGWHNQPFVPGPAIVVGRKGNVGSVTWIDGPCWPIDTAYFVESTLPLRFVVEQLRRTEFLNTHAAVPGLSRDVAYSKPFLRPPDQLMADFAQVSEALASEGTELRQQNKWLAGMRDLLLPKLITGQIDVSGLDLDAIVEGAVA